jgi:hypothetical protein
MKIFKIAFLALVLALSLYAVGNANAQNLQRGEVHGFVYDSSHALVPGAKVTISNIQRATSTNKRRINRGRMISRT